MHKPITRFVARVTLLSLVYQLVYPNVSFALTSGPTQPEVHSFEPVTTTEMVDLFTGDFVYNIPLMDVEGYPINISYHSGGSVEEEASWVGLGWNINPGVLNRAVRGVPDDFKKDNIEKYVSIKPEKNYRAGLGVGVELAGLNVLKAAGGKKKKINLSASAGMYINASNYKGMSAGVRMGMGLDLFGFASAGVNLGVGSQTGADIDYSAGLHYSTALKISKEEAAGVGVTLSSGYNTRSGYKDWRLSGGVTMVRSVEAKGSRSSGSDDQNSSNNLAEASAPTVIATNTHFASNTIPVGLQNYVPVITNRSTMTAVDLTINLGGEVFWIFPNGDINLMLSKLSFDTDGSRDAYGYLYMEEAGDTDILDFTRDKDGLFNATMSYLPLGSMTYDIYSATAQGGGGMFRPHRNDFGSVYDPKFETPTKAEQNSVNIEAGLGNLFELGGDYTGFFTQTYAGAWADVTKSFEKKKTGNLYENVYFKQAGELTKVDPNFLAAIDDKKPYELNASNIKSLPDKRPGSDNARTPRGNLIYFFTAAEASNPEIGTSSQIYSYTDTTGLKNGASTAKTAIARSNSSLRRDHQISEIVQLKEDGTRYVYGLPALNNAQTEYAFSVERGLGSTSVNDSEGVVTFDNGDNTKNNNKGIENYFSRTTTPSYAHSYLLTSVLSHDYSDLEGDGVTDDDLGGFTKFNYSRKEADYRWRLPYGTGTAQYNAGYNSDKKDDKGYYTVGSKELWYLHSIESKNFVAEFYTSKRNDARGVIDPAVSTDSKYATAPGYNALKNDATPASSYKLDSIVLYNKHDRFINKGAAVPIKTVMFNYTYELCPHVPNNADTASVLGSGKLTLKKIFIRYGRSDKNMISPYQFKYSSNNYAYSNAAKNRWGGYKKPSGSLDDFEFPYVDQNDPDNNNYSGAWQMTEIKLPSGGVINVEYESDDYAYVQDKRAMEMFKVVGVGTSSNFQPNTAELYKDDKNPFNYIYFKRRIGNELVSTSDLRRKYLDGQKVLYYDFSVDVANVDLFEQVRGYAEVEDVGITSNSDYGYIKIASRKPKGTNAKLSPITYTGINLGRYSLPHIFHPGQDYEQSSLKNILEGLAASAGELFNFFRNPMERYAEKGHAKRYDPNKSYIRLSNPDMKKKGGGSRVKSLQLNDSWESMVSGGSSASYGKKYNYTINDPGYGVISSGVASYEPQAGGDENPFRMPVKYNATDGTKFPPNDPVELYQEEPLGESLYPSPVVGYRQVEVESIHADYARSAQTLDRYEFYTAKDFPIKVQATELKPLEKKKKFLLLKSEVSMVATQGYSIAMNDMHGKPKANYNYVIKDRSNPGARSLVSSNIYEYYANGDEVSNTVNGISFDGANFNIQPCTVGQEVDLMIDSREKKENTYSISLALNLNLAIVAVIPIPIPLAFSTPSNHDRLFRSATTTKVIQQYGILKSVESFKEGARTRMNYEVYDPQTGIALITKTNNEFDDAEYTVTTPAYWTNRLMGPACSNINYQEDSATLEIQDNAEGLLTVANMGNFYVGDELLLDFKYQGVDRQVKVWISWCNQGLNLFVHPRYMQHSSNWPAPPSGTSHTINNVQVRIVRSGRTNQLKETAQTYTALSNPMTGNVLNLKPDKVINIEARVFPVFDNIKIVRTINSYSLGLPNFPGFNQCVINARGYFPLRSSATYKVKRNYVGHSRLDGTYSLINPFWVPVVREPVVCTTGAAEYLYTSSAAKDWIAVRDIHFNSSWGQELESSDATQVPRATIYGYDQTLPVAVANNSYFTETACEGFEDFRILLRGGYMLADRSPFKDSTKFPYITNLPGLSPAYKTFNTTSPSGAAIVTTESHTGLYSLFTGPAEFAQKVPHIIAINPKIDGMSFSRKTLISCWMKGSGAAPFVRVSGASLPTTVLTKKGPVVNGWQQYEGVFPPMVNPEFVFPDNVYIDDFRVCNAAGNMKTYVYNAINHKLMAILDENNYASFYEYDQEGLLVRVKKETEKGILTVQESRQSTHKAQ